LGVQIERIRTKSDSPGLADTGGEAETQAGGSPMSNNEKKPRRTFEQDLPTFWTNNYSCTSIEAACRQSPQSGVPCCEAKPEVGCRHNLSANFQWVGLSCSRIGLVQPKGGGLVHEQ
jgi:hypothetical protein